MPTLYIAEYQSFGALEIEQALDSSKVKDTKATAQKIFNELKDFASDEKHNHFLAHKTKNTLKAKNYVGTIQTKSGFCVEILPKTFDNKDFKKCECKFRFEKERIFEAFSGFSNSITTEDSIQNTASSDNQSNEYQANHNHICHAKAILLNCLATLKDTPFKHNHLANLHTLRLPLLEIFVRMFLDECERLIKAGLKSDYLCIAQNRAFLKGKLEFKDHITQNLIHKERFFTSSDEYTQNIAPNRLIQSTLCVLSCLSFSPSTQTKLDSMRFIFADISPSENIESDFAKCGNMSRAKEYKMILLWCKVFLGQKAFSPYVGSDKAIAFLFPMEKLFESFVSLWLKKCANGFSVKTQESSRFLLQDEKEKDKKNKDIFCLKPDIVMRGKDRIIIVDTKWKIPDSSLDEKKYGISQSDLYQMWAYASKYRLESSKVNVVLIYPQCDKTKDIEKLWKDKKWIFKASVLNFTKNANQANNNKGISISLAFAPLLS
ncbi:mcrBC 5-methylcytosine restriction system component [Helicobacter cinaedi]|uniref:McrC family protein n=1 Tax=Helicobacter cinaedi TaxID=213 RepID=UPI001F3F72E0|nr:McrC family protein [Helicobacter cinaedi]BDB64440.1 mcrBC 5-methylcytosine restriction system component [Helicobacter cinaedi]